VAAGSGTRLGADRPKAFVSLAGRTLLEHAVRRLAGGGRLAALVAVVPADLVDDARVLLERDAGPAGPALTVVAGGADRADSVRRGLAALPDRVRTVLVHDAARCLVPPELVHRVVVALHSHPAVVPGLPLSDTVKQVDDAGTVVGTPDRSRLRLVQTPQGFARDLLERAHREAQLAGSAASSAATDDAALVERLGEPVHVVPGDPRAAKVTTPEDLAYVGWLLTHDPLHPPADPSSSQAQAW
jgi:2-C-methyl-D-erythritol 4-phosphate cytidylyltransferase